VTPVAVQHRCCWSLCPFMATSQVTVPAPPWLGDRAAAWFCPGHERTWQVAMGTNYTWVNFTFGRAPLVGWGIIPRG